jgi:hypothetical protein
MPAALAFIIIALRPNTARTRSLARGERPVPSFWRATVPTQQAPPSPSKCVANGVEPLALSNTPRSRFTGTTRKHVR